MAIRITCINKDHGNHANPHMAISHYGWVEDGTGKKDRTDRVTMVAWLEKGIEAYVSNGGRSAWCKVNVSQAGTKFLQTVADSVWLDNLLSLPECKL